MCFFLFIGLLGHYNETIDVSHVNVTEGEKIEAYNFCKFKRLYSLSHDVTSGSEITPCNKIDNWFTYFRGAL